MRQRPALLARFDTAVLRPPPADTPWPPADRARFEALRDWCLSGAVPVMTPALAIAQLAGDGDGDASRELALQLCLERDGSLQLRALGATGRMALRLKTKLHDLMPARALRPDDPWDTGSLIASAAGLQALASFRPRRPSLIVAEGLDRPVLQRVVDTLVQGQAAWAWPVRLLVLGAAQPLGAWPVFRP